MSLRPPRLCVEGGFAALPRLRQMERSSGQAPMIGLAAIVSTGSVSVATGTATQSTVVLPPLR